MHYPHHRDDVCPECGNIRPQHWAGCRNDETGPRHHHDTKEADTT